MNIVEKAIKNNEIKFLLEGTNGYKCCKVVLIRYRLSSYPGRSG